MAKVGERVGVISHSDDVGIHVYGEGVYEGDFVPGEEAVGFLASAARDAKVPNPRIRLDNGKVVWGCESWWGTLSQYNKMIENSKLPIVRVDIDDARADARLQEKTDIEKAKLSGQEETEETLSARITVEDVIGKETYTVDASSAIMFLAKTDGKAAIHIIGENLSPDDMKESLYILGSSLELIMKEKEPETYGENFSIFNLMRDVQEEVGNLKTLEDLEGDDNGVEQAGEQAPQRETEREEGSSDSEGP
jgi:hypothetical protein